MKYVIFCAACTLVVLVCLLLVNGMDDAPSWAPILLGSLTVLNALLAAWVAWLTWGDS